MEQHGATVSNYPLPSGAHQAGNSRVCVDACRHAQTHTPVLQNTHAHARTHTHTHARTHTHKAQKIAKKCCAVPPLGLKTSAPPAWTCTIKLLHNPGCGMSNERRGKTGQHKLAESVVKTHVSFWLVAQPDSMSVLFLTWGDERDMGLHSQY